MAMLIPRSAAKSLERRASGPLWAGAGVGGQVLLPRTNRDILVREGHDREANLAAITGALAWDFADAGKFKLRARSLASGRDETDKNWICHAFNVAPNLSMNATAMKIHMRNCLSYAGEVYLLRTKEKGFTPLVGGVVEVIPCTNGERDANGMPQLVKGYNVRNPSTNEIIATYPFGGDLIRVHIPHPSDPLNANPPVAQAGLAIDTLFAHRLATRTLLLNDGMPAGMLQVMDPDVEDDDLDALERRINSKFGDPNAKGRVLVVDAETKYTPVGQSLLGQEWVLVGKSNREDLLRVFSMPPTRLGSENDATYEQDDTRMASYYRHAVLPIWDLVLAELNRIARLSGVELYIDYSEVACLQGNRKASGELANSLWLADVATRNEARKIAGLPPDKVRGEVYRSDVQLELLKVRVNLGLPTGEGAADDAGTDAAAGSTVSKDTTTKDPGLNPESEKKRSADPLL